MRGDKNITQFDPPEMAPPRMFIDLRRQQRSGSHTNSIGAHPMTQKIKPGDFIRDCLISGTVIEEKKVSFNSGGKKHFISGYLVSIVMPRREKGNRTFVLKKDAVKLNP